MATIKFIQESRQSISAMKGVISYCLQEKKVVDNATGQRMVSGISCDGENAFAEFLTTKQAYRKTDGINFYHYVQSFSPEENITPQKVHAVAREFAERAWPGHEILVTTHCDADHLHSHFVINSVSFENGKKLRQNPNTLKELRALNDEICTAHSLSVLPPYEKSGSKLSSREYRAAMKGESWKFKLMADICAAMNRSGSKQDFIVEMERCGYQVKWTDERKYITFTCPNTGKKTHRFLIKVSDAKDFKRRMDTEPGFLSELYGQFNSGIYTPRKKLIEPTPENCLAFQKFLTERWADYPDALPTRLAAELIGCAPQRVGAWMRRGVISSVSIGGVRYCSKAEFIVYYASPEMLKRPGAERYRDLIKELYSTISPTSDSKKSPYTGKKAKQKKY